MCPARCARVGRMFPGACSKLLRLKPIVPARSPRIKSVNCSATVRVGKPNPFSSGFRLIYIMARTTLSATSRPCAPPAADDNRQQHLAALLSCADRPRRNSAETLRQHSHHTKGFGGTSPSRRAAVGSPLGNVSAGWLKIHSDPEEPDQTVAALDPGERTALRLTF